VTSHSRLVQDGLLSAVLLAAGLAETWVPLSSRQGTGSAAYTSVAVVACCVPLAVRRVWPLPVAAVVLLAFPLLSALGPLYILFYGAFVPMAVALFTVARYGTGRRPWLGAALGAVPLLYLDLFVPLMQDPPERIYHWAVFVLVWLAGYGLARHEARADRNLQRAIDTEVASRAQAMAAVVEERTRIARELHDVVAHSVSVMVVQAGAAEQVVDDDPGHVREALETIRRTGTTALDEMRRVVSMLREAEADLAPQPGLTAGLPALVDDARAAGLDVSLEVSGPVRDLPAGLDLTAYRIVQEALSNVRRHASASRVTVRVSYDADAIGLEVCDDGVGAPDLRPGHGLIGMRERVGLYGGRLETVTRPGFTVRAVLPAVPS
jgi:signal transduction histidine kinase